MYTGPPFTSMGKRCWTEDRLGAVSSDFPRERDFCPVVIQSQHPGYGAKGLILVPFTRGDITNFSGHCLITAMEVQVVLLTVPVLVLVEEATSKRGRLIILDFGLDIFCLTADS